jgi:hypothetical protein
MGSMGLVFWTYAVLTLVLPEAFAPRGYILGILGGLLAIFLIVTGVAAGRNTVERARVPMEVAFPAMGGFTGGSYCLYMGIVGMKGWYEARNAPD